MSKKSKSNKKKTNRPKREDQELKIKAKKKLPKEKYRHSKHWLEEEE